MTDRNEDAVGGEPRGYASRRRFLQATAGTLGASLALPGTFYKLVDTIAEPPVRTAVAASPPAQEQYLLQDTQVINVDGSGIKSEHGSVAIRVLLCTYPRPLRPRGPGSVRTPHPRGPSTTTARATPAGWTSGGRTATKRRT